MGPSTAHDILQLTSVTTPGGATTRLLIPSDDVRILTHHDDGLFEEQGDMFSGGAALGTIPSALARWTEECRVLDGESMHDCVTGTGKYQIKMFAKALELGKIVSFRQVRIPCLIKIGLVLNWIRNT